MAERAESRKGTGKGKQEDGKDKRQQGREKEFSREQLLASERFRDQKDLVSALLSDDGKYTVSAVEQEISNYMKGMVK